MRISPTSKSLQVSRNPTTKHRSTASPSVVAITRCVRTAFGSAPMDGLHRWCRLRTLQTARRLEILMPSGHHPGGTSP